MSSPGQCPVQVWPWKQEETGTQRASVLVKDELSLHYLFGSTSSPGTRHLSAFPSCASSASCTKSNTCYISMKTNRSYLKGPCHLKSPSLCVIPKCSQNQPFHTVSSGVHTGFLHQSGWSFCERWGTSHFPPHPLRRPFLLLSISGAPELSFPTRWCPRVSEVAL